MSQVSSRKTALVVCPGRGSYGRNELGYLRRYGQDLTGFWSEVDAFRKQKKQPTVTELDNQSEFSLSLHVPGENAAALIYCASYTDFFSIDREKIEVVAVTGNSMGWYTALGVTQSLPGMAGFEVANTMGSMMQGGIIGGQLIYPIADENWVPQADMKKNLEGFIAEANQLGEAYVSIYFGGYVVVGADDKAMSFLMKALPKVQDRFPMKLPGHAAFHTPLLRQTSEKAFAALKPSLFHKPNLPLVDGRGSIWQPYSTDLEALYDYTLHHQVTQTYDFSKAVTVGLKEFAPDVVILLGPGDATGGALGQIMIENKWLGCQSKQDFIARQSQQPFVLSMGREEQRSVVV